MTFIGNGGATYAMLPAVTIAFTLQQWQYLLAATSHTMTNTYATFYTQ